MKNRNDYWIKNSWWSVWTCTQQSSTDVVTKKTLIFVGLLSVPASADRTQLIQSSVGRIFRICVDFIFYLLIDLQLCLCSQDKIKYQFWKMMWNHSRVLPTRRQRYRYDIVKEINWPVEKDLHPVILGYTILCFFLKKI